MNSAYTPCTNGSKRRWPRVLPNWRNPRCLNTEGDFSLQSETAVVVNHADRHAESNISVTGDFSVSTGIHV